MVANVMQTTALDNEDDTAVRLATIPFSHIYGLWVFLHCSLYLGGTTVLLPKFELKPFLGLIQSYRVTHLNIVPPIVLLLCKDPLVDSYDLSSLQIVNSGAAPLGKELAAQFTQRLKVPIREGYGMTEMSPVGFTTPRAEIVPGTVGVLIPNMKCKIIDEEGNELGYEERGQVCFQGPNVMKGYWNNETATRETFSDGWLLTGDVGIAHTNGYFSIVDRIKELIKYKGHQVVPAELEGYLLGHPKIADAAVIPRPDDRAGEVPKAYVVLKPNESLTERDIQAYIESMVNPNKYLRGGVEFIDAIPKSPSGKILRRVLRDRQASSLKAKL
ncbi:hypothetical protein HDU91_000755 [Kappamyces sp. JEL0680]|nr:hypothetical protein HDU91_000755 [Kappamyces sp. JEL0680]